MVFALYMWIIYHQFLKWHSHWVSLELNGQIFKMFPTTEYLNNTFRLKIIFHVSYSET